MEYTQTIGNVNELKCLLAFLELGYECSIPYGNNAKYDFIVDVEGKLLKILCKSSRYVRNHGELDINAIMFDTTCRTTNTKKTIAHKYTLDLIDFFATCFNNNVYLIPVEECSTSKVLRFEPPRNNVQNYNKAEDYLITKLFNKSELLISSQELYSKRLENNNTNKKHYYCKSCGKELSDNHELCKECYNRSRINLDKPDREELKNLIRTEPFTTIGEMYGVSDNMVRKWCKSYGLPYTKTLIKTYSDEDWKNI